jgi:Flp pilus assembly protein TadB
MIVPASIVAMVMAFVFGYSYIRSTSRRESLRSLMRQQGDSAVIDDSVDAKLDEGDPSALPAEVSLEERRAAAKTKEPTLEEKMFHAGLFSEEQKRDFKRLQVVLPTVLGLFGAMGGLSQPDVTTMLGFPLAGAILGYLLPIRLLARKAKQRDEEIMFFLPLVIEQVSIGVSSSLDIGPCLARVVEMADERDSHNPVTELLRYAQFFIKSGVSLQDALNEVGRLSGNNDIKHSFKALAQVARYGGEISKQLQDLSEAVSSTREMRVEEKIKKLELSATAPVAFVFAGFLFILLMGFGMSLMKGLEGKS